jgi:glycosyltransferase involved in cell wall biosynthesis
VQPSYIEGLSLSLLEAMAAGRAIICSNIPANAELVTHHVEGLIIDPSSHEDIKNALVILLNDKGLRDKYGLNAVLKAESYDEDIVFPKINEIYEKILKRC